ncbi:MAG: histidine phosphatase family protein [Acidobacteriota bacterium]|nr:histidine phosphatase family protein [Acidobacteriota bacterium]
MSRFFLVRHGTTEWNAQGRIQGQSDPSLNETGRSQARRLGMRLSSVPFAEARCSDLRRCSETAAGILPGRNEVRLQEMPELREKNFGAWEGLTFREVEARYPDMYRNWLTAADPSFAPPGGESDLQLYSRADTVVDRLREIRTDSGSNLLVVTHGGMLRALIARLLGLSAQKMWKFRFANAGLSLVSVFDDGSAVVDLLNDTSHLEADFGE